MPSPYRDDELLAVLPYARGYDRELLISALGDAVEVPGVDVTRELLLLHETEKGHAKRAALSSLCRRLGEAGTPYALDALHSTGWMTQDTGAGLIARLGSEDAAEPLFAWFVRKLRTKDRPLGNWTPYHLTLMVQYADRHRVYADLAAILVAHWDRLSIEEHAWLDRFWPALLDQDGDPVASQDIPGPTRVGGHSVDSDLSPRPTDVEPGAAGTAEDDLGAAHTAEAYRRASRRHARATAAPPEESSRTRS